MEEEYTENLHEDMDETTDMVDEINQTEETKRQNQIDINEKKQSAQGRLFLIDYKNN